MAEQKWGLIEQMAPRVFQAADAGHLLDDPVMVSAAKDLLALHWARSRATLEVLRDSVQKNVERVLNGESIRADALRRIFEQEAGLIAAGPGALRWAAERLAESLLVQGAAPEFLNERISHSLETARQLLAHEHLQLGIALEGEFILSDAPAASVDPTYKWTGPHKGVGWHAAETILMPIGRRVILATGSEPSVEHLDQAAVSSINYRQAASAVHEVYCHPESPLLG